MPHRAWSTSDTVHPARSSLFAGDHVHLDEARWSPVFEAQVSSWASAAPLLMVMESGEAMLNVHGNAPAPAGSWHDDRVWAPFADTIAVRPRAMELCAVFRYETGAAERAFSAASAAPAAVPIAARSAEGRLVQISPNALLRYYWRRHALSLRYPSPNEHVEGDAIALLRHAASRIRSADRTASTNSSPGRVRHRLLARKAKALMAEAIADPHPVAQVARALDTSPFHLAHVFRSEVGSSPHQYLVQLRLVAALRELRAGAPDLSKLALELGFCHHSHFTAVFRQTLGYTPREVRRMLTAECIADLGIVAHQCS